MPTQPPTVETFDHKTQIRHESSPSSSILRTEETIFADLPSYPFRPCYLQLPALGVGGDRVPELRIHYVDEGSTSAPETILLLHGEPSWSFLYRKMIPILHQAGYRVVAPDLIGFGKSDKPSKKEDYTYERHIEWITNFIEKLNLQNITLYCQDWGSLIGLHIAYAERTADRFSRVVLSNGGLPTGEERPTDAFYRWQRYVAKQKSLPVGDLIQGATVRRLEDNERKAYDLPYPDARFQAGALKFPSLVPTPENPFPKNKDIWKRMQSSKKPMLLLFSDSDPVTKGGDKRFRKLPGAQDQKHATIPDAGHFLQEDKPELIAEHIINFNDANKSSQRSRL